MASTPKPIRKMVKARELDLKRFATLHGGNKKLPKESKKELKERYSLKEDYPYQLSSEDKAHSKKMTKKSAEFYKQRAAKNKKELNEAHAHMKKHGG